AQTARNAPPCTRTAPSPRAPNAPAISPENDRKAKTLLGSSPHLPRPAAPLREAPARESVRARLFRRALGASSLCLFAFADELDDRDRSVVAATVADLDDARV